VVKQFSPSAIQALKEALTHIYWRKKDIRSFVYHTIQNNAIVSTIDWENSVKNESIQTLVDRMLARPDLYYDDLLRLFDAVMHFNDFSHLKQWDNSEAKIDRAKDSVAALRKNAQSYFVLQEEKERAEQRRIVQQVMAKEKESFQERVSELKRKFGILIVEGNAQRRGYLFEAFLNELFVLFDLDPKESFKIVGEQIDGAFTFDNQDYLLEAKWQSDKIQAGDLYDFGGKIAGKLKSTLGLFVAINGFSSESTQVDSPVIKSMILVDGEDIVAVLDNRIPLKDLIYRKRRHASESGKIMLPFRDF
jgi:Restriction endonuclease